jgi:hypothetical protein
MPFPVTRLSVVERTRSSDADVRRLALDTIIEAYWKPVYKYLRMKWSLTPDDAADLTQEFFTTALEKDVVEKYDPARARFRTYLRLCLDGFASNARKAERRLKRGGGVTLVPLDFETAEGEIATREPAVGADVDELFYREWVRALLERSVAELKRAADEAGRGVMFEVFARYDLATVTNHLAAMRKQFRAILLERLRELTSSEEEWEAEAAKLLGVPSTRHRAGRDPMARSGQADDL